MQEHQIHKIHQEQKEGEETQQVQQVEQVQQGEMPEEVISLNGLLSDPEVIRQMTRGELNEVRPLFNKQGNIDNKSKATLLRINITRQGVMSPRNTGYLSIGDVIPEGPEHIPAMVYSPTKANLTAALQGNLPEERTYRLLGSLVGADGPVYILKSNGEVLMLPLEGFFKPITVAVEITYKDAYAIEKYRHENSYPQAMEFSVVVSPSFAFVSELELPRTGQRLQSQSQFMQKLKEDASPTEKEFYNNLAEGRHSQMSLLFNGGIVAVNALGGAITTSTEAVDKFKSGEDLLRHLQEQHQVTFGTAQRANRNQRVEQIRDSVGQPAQEKQTEKQTEAQREEYRLEDNI